MREVAAARELEDARIGRIELGGAAGPRRARRGQRQLVVVHVQRRGREPPPRTAVDRGVAVQPDFLHESIDDMVAVRDGTLDRARAVGPRPGDMPLRVPKRRLPRTKRPRQEVEEHDRPAHAGVGIAFNCDIRRIAEGTLEAREGSLTDQDSAPVDIIRLRHEAGLAAADLHDVRHGLLDGHGVRVHAAGGDVEGQRLAVRAQRPLRADCRCGRQAKRHRAPKGALHCVLDCHCTSLLSDQNAHARIDARADFADVPEVAGSRADVVPVAVDEVEARVVAVLARADETLVGAQFQPLELRLDPDAGLGDDAGVDILRAGGFAPGHLEVDSGRRSRRNIRERPRCKGTGYDRRTERHGHH